MMLDIAATFCPKFETYQGNKINVSGKYLGLYKDLFLTFHSESCKSIYRAKPTGFYRRVFLICQIWLLNYYVKSSSNHLSNKIIITGVSREKDSAVASLYPSLAAK